MAMVSSTMGAMNSVLHKLAALEAEQLTPTLRDILRGGLMNLNDVLHSFARRSVRDPLINEWMLQVREVTYDVEDWIDGALIRLSSRPAMDFWCSDPEEQIQQFKAQIEDLQDLCKRYSLLGGESAAPGGGESADPAPTRSDVVTIQATQHHGKAPHLETVERERKLIVEDLTNKECHRKVVCIIRSRGVGKTTLATQVYRQLLGQFDCGAFVHLGKNTSVNKTLVSILQQVNPNWRYDMDSQSRDCHNSCAITRLDEKKVVATLWATLRKKSYFVLLDDVRSKWIWKSISCVLPNNDQCVERILVTTCIEDVAESCCIHPSDVVHHMKSLGDDDSIALFDSKVSFSENKSQNPVSQKILQICGGIPLAVSLAAGLLFRKSACLPQMSLMLDQCQSTPQGVQKILGISYFDLPLPVRSCFLYLSAFPENNAIKKDRLIRRWIAEGLVPKKDERFWETGEGFDPKGDEDSFWKTGESYFHELIRRGLIQPAFDHEDDQPIGCTVHGAVLDFMISLCTEENFITAGSEQKSELFPFFLVRRFCLGCRDDEDEGNTLNQKTYSCVASSSDRISGSGQDQEDKWNRFHLSRVRSLVYSGNAIGMPYLGALKLVRVLDHEDTKGMMENKRLESIGYLSLLKYLGLVGTDVTMLPQQIMALEQLTTLDLRRTRVRNLPAFTVTGRKLISLLADELRVRRGIGAMQNLEELSKVLLGNDGSLASEVAELVKELRQLRMLGVRFGRLNDHNEKDRDGVRHFLIELGKSELQSICLDNYIHGLLDILVESWSHKRTRYLRKFELRMTRRPWLSEIPQDMACITALTHLHVGVSKVEAHGVRALGLLPNLLQLKLLSDTTSPRLILGRMDGFRHLKVFWYQCVDGGIQFEQGAMPELERLRLDLNVQENMYYFDFGIEHLTCLLHVRAIIDCKDNSIASKVESELTRQVSLNRNNPVSEFDRRGQQCSSIVKAPHDSVIAIHSYDEWFTHVDHNKLVVVHFTAAWCGPSQRMAPLFADLAKKNPDVIFLKVDVDEMKKISAQFQVEAMPTFIFMTEGTEVRVVGGGPDKSKELQETLDMQISLRLSRRTG